MIKILNSCFYSLSASKLNKMSNFVNSLIVFFMSDKIKVLDKQFKKYITDIEIQKAVKDVAKKIDIDYKGKDPLLLVILNGAFMFAADLIRSIEMDTRVSFVKLASYQGTKSTEKVVKLIGLNEELAGQDVIIVEDIVDTGITLENLLYELKTFKPNSVRIASFLFKPNAFQKNYKIDYIGLEIPNDFILGYGLDYNQAGRNLKDIYKIID